MPRLLQQKLMSLLVSITSDLGCFNGNPAPNSPKTKMIHQVLLLAFRVQMHSPRPSIYSVCKCLQLICRSALHLTFSTSIYITIYVINCFNQTSLSWQYDYLPGAWIFVNAMICKRASQVMGFVLGSFGGQAGGLVQSMGAKGKNSWEALEIGIG